jgi:excisionase family DNA binding protein
MIERWISRREVAPLLQVNPATVTRWTREGKLPHSRTLGGHRRYLESEIRALAARLDNPVRRRTL